MLKRQSLAKILVVLLCVSAGSLCFIGNGVMIGDRQHQNDASLELGIWSARTIFAQSFIALHDNLCRLDIFFDSYHAWESPSLEYRLFEIDTTADPHELPAERILTQLKEVRFQHYNGWLISAHMPNSFTFAPIPDSRQKRYLLTIQAPALRSAGGGSILLASAQDRYDNGDLLIDGVKQPGDLAFRVLYQRPRLALIQESLARLLIRKPGWFATPTFYYLLFGGYALGLLALLVLLL